jgi:glycosyltransferase involved in cell wall biosynthesis
MYKVEEYLNACLESITKQTYAEFECICIDDESPDRCAAIANEYAARDSRFWLIRQKNQGLAGARNAGIDNAAGDYIMFVDADDFLHSEALDIFYSSARDNDADYVCASFATVEEDADWRNWIYQDLNSDLGCSLVTSNPIIDWLDRCSNYGVSACTRLYSRRLFDNLRFVPEMRIHEDSYFCALILMRSQKAVFMPKPLYYYRQRRGSLIRSDSFRESLTALADNAELVAKLATELDLSAKHRNLLLKNCGMSYWAIAATNLVLNETMPRDEWRTLLSEARRIFRTLKRRGHFKHSMVVGRPNRIALFVAFELRSPLLFRAFYRIAWPDRWRKRIQLANAGI